MEQNKDGWPERFTIIPERLCRIGRAINRFVLGPHLFSSVSDHEFKHPLDDTFDRPAYTEPSDGEAGG